MSQSSRITSAEAHKIAKPLLIAKLKEGDKWYAITMTWFAKFKYFAYLDNKDALKDNNNINIQQLTNRALPPSMNNSQLKDVNKTYQLQKDLIEYKNFVFVCEELYNYFIKWFGIDEGSLTFERGVIDLSSNDNISELVIETFPIFVCYVLCDNSGEPDNKTQKIVSLSRKKNLKYLTDSVLKQYKDENQIVDHNNDDNDNANAVNNNDNNDQNDDDNDANDVNNDNANDDNNDNSNNDADNNDNNDKNNIDVDKADDNINNDNNADVDGQNDANANANDDNDNDADADGENDPNSDDNNSNNDRNDSNDNDNTLKIRIWRKEKIKTENETEGAADNNNDNNDNNDNNWKPFQDGNNDNNDNDNDSNNAVNNDDDNIDNNSNNDDNDDNNNNNDNKPDNDDNDNDDDKPDNANDNDNNDNNQADNVDDQVDNDDANQLPSYDQVKPNDDDDNNDNNDKELDYEWVLVNAAECLAQFEDWAMQRDLSSSITYMIEINDEKTSKWKRHNSHDWRSNLTVGHAIDIYDKAYSRWYPGSVVEINKAEGNCKVHYTNYDPKYDEWLDIDSVRIADLYTFTIDKSKASYGSYYTSYQADDETPPTVPGSVGLRNLGNTCFMNSTIQCLAHCPYLVKYFISSSYKSDVNTDNPLGWGGRVAITWSELLIKYWSSKYSVLSPNKLKNILAEIQPRFSGYQQHDSSELLQFLLDGLHEDLNRVKKKPYTTKVESNGNDNLPEIALKSWNTHKLRNDSIIVDLIQGQIKSRVECPDCPNISVTFDPFMFLSVPIPTKKKKIYKMVTIIRMDLNIIPTKYLFQLQQYSSIGELKDIINEKLNIPNKRMIICDIFNHKINNFYENYNQVDTIMSNDHIICYEIPTDDEMDKLLFNDYYNKDDDNDKDIPKLKYRLVPITHQYTVASQGYDGKTNLRFRDIGFPLLIKLPLAYNISIELINYYISSLVSPYFIQSNLDKYKPFKIPKEWLNDDNDNNNVSGYENITSLDSGDDEPTKKLFNDNDDRSSDDNNGANDNDDNQQPGAPGTTNDNDDGNDDNDDDNDNDDNANNDDVKGSPDDDDDDVKGAPDNVAASNPFDALAYSIHVMDRYGRYCGHCTWNSYSCDGCNLNKLKSFFLKDSSYDTKTLCIRWKLGAQKIYNHAAFDYPVDDVSVTNYENMKNKKRDSYSSYRDQKTILLSDCINDFIKQETLGKNDTWYCRQCKDHKQARKKLDIYTLPKICIIHLKRFTQNEYYRDKNDVPIKYPITGLDFSEWLNNNSDDNIYDLFAVSIHSGSLGGGHYIAYGKNLQNNKWYDFNDSSVSEMNEQDAFTSSAYVLFYSRRNKKTNINVQT